MNSGEGVAGKVESRTTRSVSDGRIREGRRATDGDSPEEKEVTRRKRYRGPEMYKIVH